MTIRELSLDEQGNTSNIHDGESTCHNIWDYLTSNPNIVVAGGINWCHLYQVTEEQLVELEVLFKEKSIRWKLGRKTIGIDEDAVRRIAHRRWFLDPKLYPGKVEKAKTIFEIQEWKVKGGPSGIAASAYDELLENLSKVPDMDDIVGYELSFHY